MRDRNSKLHLVGLCSNGGVHSHISHLLGLLKLAKAQQVPQDCIHAIADGRDTAPTEGIQAIEQIQNYIDLTGIGQIVTLSGRYYAMDRDRRWDRTKRAYDVMTQDSTGERSAIEVLQASYAAGVKDEFVIGQRIAPKAVEAGDGVIFFNFRPDRARQLTQAFVSPDFNGFERNQILPLSFVTFTQYEPELPVAVAFKPQNLDNILGEVISHHSLKQFRTAETEKYPHVTYFFNGGREEPFAGEDRELVMSPQVATYDREPQISAQAVTDVAIAAIEKRIYSLVVINYANPDMVGHTGQISATIEALETVDRCLGLLLQSISQVGGTAIVTADRGNAEQMQDEQGNPWTADSTNPVPLILVEGESKNSVPSMNVNLRSDGCLADIAPTILDLLQLPQPAEMTGRSLIKASQYIEASQYQVLATRTPMKVTR